MDSKLLKKLVWLPVILLAILNFATVFTPEIGFDALWYHLTLPKLWLLKHQWHFDGGLLYYSVMPRLTETIFIPLIKYTGYIGPKLVQYLSGLGTAYVIWKITSQLSFSKISKSLSVSLFYCTWLVSWQSGSAYIDLFRTFLETLALYFFISGSKLKGGLLLGLSVGTKWLSLGSVAIYALVFGLPLIFPALLVASPWFYLALRHTGNPIYPMFDPILHNSFSSVWLVIVRVLFLPVILALPYDDFLSPLIFILVLLSSVSLFSRHEKIRRISLIAILGGVLSVSFDPPSSRYFLPYLPALAISSVALIEQLKPKLKTIFTILVILSSLFIFGLRLAADKKYLPFLTGRQTENQFLTSMSGRLPDTFIDSDDYVKTNLKDTMILIDKLHNLYYFPYNFDHTSWVDNQSTYDYLITKDTDPQNTPGQLIHTNPIGIQIYKLKP